jgi:biotin carboxyl carrier protein
VNVGDEVKEGQTLIILSSMKMEIPVVADKDGVVEEIFVEKAQSIEADYLLLKIA